MLRAVIADISGIVNIADIADVADIIMDIADIADVVNIQILWWKQVGTYEVLPRCLLYKAVPPPPPGSGCCYRVNCNRVCCCLPGC